MLSPVFACFPGENMGDRLLSLLKMHSPKCAVCLCCFLKRCLWLTTFDCDTFDCEYVIFIWFKTENLKK